MRRFMTFTMAVLLVLTMVIPASATQGNVRYSGDSGNFIFATEQIKIRIAVCRMHSII